MSKPQARPLSTSFSLRRRRPVGVRVAGSRVGMNVVCPTPDGPNHTYSCTRCAARPPPKRAACRPTSRQHRNKHLAWGRAHFSCQTCRAELLLPRQLHMRPEFSSRTSAVVECLCWMRTAETSKATCGRSCSYYPSRSVTSEPSSAGARPTNEASGIEVPVFTGLGARAMLQLTGATRPTGSLTTSCCVAV